MRFSSASLNLRKHIALVETEETLLVGADLVHVDVVVTGMGFHYSLQLGLCLRKPRDSPYQVLVDSVVI